MRYNVCDSYCSHGGVCELEPGHFGLHDSGYCTWNDNEARSKGDADAILSEKVVDPFMMRLFREST